ncbi:MAG: sigma-70 family RNA polymerase sigma factor [Gammaproteobacteria bacterium]|nr:sigma-70 family RNA polymerase sigma factor [Gammaproteobacteria bacterium]
MPDEHDARVRFNRIVSEYSQDVFRYAFWLCRDRTMAEELSQETFLRAWKAIDSLDDEKAAKSWLFTIVRRENARQYERKRLDMVDDVDFERVGAPREEYDTSTEAFVLRRALEALPEEYREPLVLQVIGGYSTEEIAEQMGIKAGAVMTRLFRARKKLREVLGEREE